MSQDETHAWKAAAFDKLMRERHQLCDSIRSIANDPRGYILTDDFLEPFILEAEKKVALIATAVYAYSKGMNEVGEKFMNMAGLIVEIEKEKPCEE